MIAVPFFIFVAFTILSGLAAYHCQGGAVRVGWGSATVGCAVSAIGFGIALMQASWPS